MLRSCATLFLLLVPPPQLRVGLHFHVESLLGHLDVAGSELALLPAVAGGRLVLLPAVVGSGDVQFPAVAGVGIVQLPAVRGG